MIEKNPGVRVVPAGGRARQVVPKPGNLKTAHGLLDTCEDPRDQETPGGFRTHRAERRYRNKVIQCGFQKDLQESSKRRNKMLRRNTSKTSPLILLVFLTNLSNSKAIKLWAVTRALPIPIPVQYNFNASFDQSKLLSDYLAGNWTLEAEELSRQLLSRIAHLNGT